MWEINHLINKTSMVLIWVIEKMSTTIMHDYILNVNHLHNHLIKLELINFALLYIVTIIII